MMKNNEWRTIREALIATDCDRSGIKQWQKKYERLMKQMNEVREQYRRARRSTLRVQELAAAMEDAIVREKIKEREDQRVFAEWLKEMKRLQNSFDHEFIISREDREFHSTYDSVLRLGVKALEDPGQCLVLQSEIENLLSLLAENLQKEKPELLALGYFYQEHSDRELVDLPPSQRVMRVAEIYQDEFYRPIEELLLVAIPLADSWMEDVLGREDRRSRIEAGQLKVLWNPPGISKSPEARAKQLIDSLLQK